MSVFSRAAKLARLTFYTGANDSPKILILFVTAGCNQFCNHCFYSGHLNRSKDLSLEEIGKISKNLGQVDNLLISGGEPFLRRDLPDIITLFYRQNRTRSFSIPTNGTLGNRIDNALAVLKTKCPEARININFSFDGLERTHNKIRNFKNAFRKSMSNLASLRTKYSRDHHLKFFIACTIMKTNSEEMIPFLKYAEKNFTPKIPVLHGFLRGKPKDPSLSLPGIKQLRKIHAAAVKQMKEASLTDKIICNAAFESKISVLRNKKQVFQCRGGELIGVIHANGDVSSCELLPPIGNIREADSFQALWHSKKAVRQREFIKEKKCFCTHECFIAPSLIYTPMSWILLPYFYVKNLFMNTSSS